MAKSLQALCDAAVHALLFNAPTAGPDVAAFLAAAARGWVRSFVTVGRTRAR